MSTDTVAMELLKARGKDLPREKYAYELSTPGQYGMDIIVSAEPEVDETTMSFVLPFASGVRRDGVGDLLEVGGIDCSRHRLNPIALFDHGKHLQLPIGLCEYPDTKQYTIAIDPVAKNATARVFVYQGKSGVSALKVSGTDGTTPYDHALFCEQLFDLWAKKYIRAGSIGYQVKAARELSPDYETGTPKGLHLLSVLMLEASAVVLPANADTVAKCLSLASVCGKPLSPYLVKSLQPYAPEKKAMLGWEERQEKTMETAGVCPQCGSQKTDHVRSTQGNATCQDCKHVWTDPNYGKDLTVPVPTGDLTETNIPPADWKPGLGADCTKDMDDYPAVREEVPVNDTKALNFQYLLDGALSGQWEIFSDMLQESGKTHNEANEIIAELRQLEHETDPKRGGSWPTEANRRRLYGTVLREAGFKSLNDSTELESEEKAFDPILLGGTVGPPLSALIGLGVRFLVDRVAQWMKSNGEAAARDAAAEENVRKKAERRVMRYLDQLEREGKIEVVGGTVKPGRKSKSLNGEEKAFGFDDAALLGLIGMGTMSIAHLLKQVMRWYHNVDEEEFNQRLQDLQKAGKITIHEGVVSAVPEQQAKMLNPDDDRSLSPWYTVTADGATLYKGPDRESAYRIAYEARRSDKYQSVLLNPGGGRPERIKSIRDRYRRKDMPKDPAAREIIEQLMFGTIKPNDAYQQLLKAGMRKQDAEREVRTTVQAMGQYPWDGKAWKVVHESDGWWVRGYGEDSDDEGPFETEGEARDRLGTPNFPHGYGHRYKNLEVKFNWADNPNGTSRENRRIWISNNGDTPRQVTFQELEQMLGEDAAKQAISTAIRKGTGTWHAVKSLLGSKKLPHRQKRVIDDDRISFRVTGDGRELYSGPDEMQAHRVAQHAKRSGKFSSVLLYDSGLGETRIKSLGLDATRKKYRPTKGLRRRLRKSVPGTSITHVSVKDLDAARELAESKGVKFAHVGSTNGFAKVKMTGEDEGMDLVAREFGKRIKSLRGMSMKNQKDIRVVNNRSGGGIDIDANLRRMLNNAGVEFNYAKPGNSGSGHVLYYPRGFNLSKVEDVLDRAGYTYHRTGDGGIHVKPKSLKKSYKNMDMEMDPDLDETVDTKDMSDPGNWPYGAQVAQRVIEDHKQLLQDYDEHHSLLELDGLKKLLQKKLEGVASDLDEWEAAVNKHYPDIAQHIIGEVGGKDLTEEEVGDVEGELETLGSDLEDIEEDLDLEFEDVEDKDMNTMDDNAVPADSDPEPEPTAEEALEGMETKRLFRKVKLLRARRKALEEEEEEEIKRLAARRKSACDCGKEPCECEKSLKPRRKDFENDMIASDSPVDDKPEKEDMFGKGLEPYELSKVGEASEHAKALSGMEMLDEDARMKAFHYHKTLEGMAQVEDMAKEGKSEFVGDPEFWAEEGAEAEHKDMPPGDTDAPPGPDAMNGADLPKSMHPHRQACKDASVFFGDAARTKDWGQRHRSDAEAVAKALEEIAASPTDATPPPEEVGFEVGEMGEKRVPRKTKDVKEDEEEQKRLLKALQKRLSDREKQLKELRRVQNGIAKLASR